MNIPDAFETMLKNLEQNNLLLGTCTLINGKRAWFLEIEDSYNNRYTYYGETIKEVIQKVIKCKS